MSPALSATYPLKNKRILVAVTGSIAACKADRIVRELQWRGAEVQVMLTRSGADYFAPRAAAALTGNPVLTDEYQRENRDNIVHIETINRSDCILVAPATANRLLELDNPTAHDLFSTIIYAFDGPIFYAPAMNEKMWRNPDLQGVVEKYRDRIIFPESGEMACGSYGPGRLPPPEEIAEKLSGLLWPSPLAGQSWLVSGGPTREKLDAIRYFSNRSSGRMGEAIARIGGLLGGEISYLSSVQRANYPAVLYQTERIESARDLLEKARELIPGAAGYIGAAAVADYAPESLAGKLSSEQESLRIKLTPTPDIISTLKREFNSKSFVGFAAQEELEVEAARKKLAGKKLDAILLNAISEDCFGGDEGRLIFLSGDRFELDLGRRSKLELALQLWLCLLDREIA